jgi:hypothetical protein
MPGVCCRCETGRQFAPRLRLLLLLLLLLLRAMNLGVTHCQLALQRRRLELAGILVALRRATGRRSTTDSPGLVNSSSSVRLMASLNLPRSPRSTDSMSPMSLMGLVRSLPPAECVALPRSLSCIVSLPRSVPLTLPALPRSCELELPLADELVLGLGWQERQQGLAGSMGSTGLMSSPSATDLPSSVRSTG